MSSTDPAETHAAEAELGWGEQSADRPPLIQADQPWSDATLATLYDAFPFDADLGFYRDLAARHGDRILELACGTGRVAIPLAQAENEVVGIDASPHMLALAKRKAIAAGVRSRVHLIEGDMRWFQLDRQFDLAIIAVKSFAYLVDRGDQHRALAAVAGHLRPGGALALDLMHPQPSWLLEPPGSLRQDLVHHVPETGMTVARAEAVVSTNLATQIRIIRSVYEMVHNDGSVRKRFVEWPYRYLHHFEAEHLLERAGFEVEAIYGGYRGEPFVSDSTTMLFIARRG